MIRKFLCSILGIVVSATGWATTYYYLNPGEVGPETAVDLTQTSVWHTGSKTGAEIGALSALAASDAIVYLNGQTNTVTVPENTTLNIKRIEMASQSVAGTKKATKIVFDFPASSTLTLGSLYGGQSTVAKDVIWKRGVFNCTGSAFCEWYGNLLFYGPQTVVSNATFSLKHHHLKYEFTDGMKAVNSKFCFGSGNDGVENVYDFNGPGTLLTNCTFECASHNNSAVFISNKVTVANAGTILLGGLTNSFTVSDATLNLNQFQFWTSGTSCGNVMTFEKGAKVTGVSNSYTLLLGNASTSRNTVNIDGGGTVFDANSGRIQGNSNTVNVTRGAVCSNRNSFDIGYGSSCCAVNVSGVGSAFTAAVGLSVGTSYSSTFGGNRMTVSDRATASVAKLSIGSEFSSNNFLRVTDGATFSVSTEALVKGAADFGNNGIEVENATIDIPVQLRYNVSSASAPTNILSVAGTNGSFKVYQLKSDAAPVALRFSVPREGKTDGLPYLDLHLLNENRSGFDNHPERFHVAIAADKKWAQSGRQNSVDLTRPPAVSTTAVANLETLMNDVDPATLGKMTLTVNQESDYVYLRLHAGPQHGLVLFLQ